MARRELTKSRAEEYRKAPKGRKGQILDALCEEAGWSRDNARRQLKRALRKGGKEREGRRPRPLKRSGRARQVLVNAWALAGTPCGQYLRVMIADGLLGRLVENGELRGGPKNKGYAVSGGDPALGEVEAMSSATIDRYLKEARKGMEPLARSTTRRSSHPLKGEIPFGKSYALVSRPGYLSTDTVAHCGNTMKGDHIWTLNSTDACSGQTSTCPVKGRARKWIIEEHDRIFQMMPFKVVAVNYDGGSESVNYEMIDYSALHNYQMTRSRPYHKNDNCHVEQKNYEIVRKHAFRYRYEGDEALALLNELWHWVCLRKNYLMPTRKRTGHTKTKSGRTRGVYDSPKSPYHRLVESKQIPKKTKEALTKAYESLNDAEVTREINRIQLRLLGLVTDKNMVEFINDAIAAIQVA